VSLEPRPQTNWRDRTVEGSKRRAARRCAWMSLISLLAASAASGGSRLAGCGQIVPQQALLGRDAPTQRTPTDEGSANVPDARHPRGGRRESNKKGGGTLRPRGRPRRPGLKFDPRRFAGAPRPAKVVIDLHQQNLGPPHDMTIARPSFGLRVVGATPTFRSGSEDAHGPKPSKRGKNVQTVYCSVPGAPPKRAWEGTD